MALLTLVEPGSRRELCLVLVTMAFQASAEFNFVKRVFPLRNVTLSALQSRVLALQRILR